MNLFNPLQRALSADLQIPLWGWLLAALVVIFVASQTSGKRPSVPWFRKSTNRPALYLFQSVGDPYLVKVGYTSRKTESRQAELERKLGDRLVLVRRIRMPHAYVAEQLAHRYLGTKGWRLPWSRGLGGEWYLVPGERGLLETARLMEIAARDVEKQAKRRFSWHRTAEVTITDTAAMPESRSRARR